MTATPEADRYGTSTVTANRLGRTGTTLNEINEAFVAFAATADGPVLDIGCAYGIAARAALAAGATVVANDVGLDHLTGLAERCPPEDRERLRLVQGHFPRDLSFRPGSLAAVHAANLLNFLTGEEIAAGVADLHAWLRPGGRVFVISATPYANNIRGFIETYERRRDAGEPWPGFCERLKDYSDDPTMDELPEWLHLLDDAVLRRVFEAAGFRVELAEMFHRRNTPGYIALDGRENVRLIAVKD